MLKVNDPEARMTEADQRMLRSWPDGGPRARPSFPCGWRSSSTGQGLNTTTTTSWQQLATSAAGWDTTGIRTFMLTHDSYLRENVFWRFFEVEGGGEISLANIDKFSSEDGSWKDTVVGLVNDGVLDRDRILRSCLEALNRDFSSYRAGWFSRLYDALDPSARRGRDPTKTSTAPAHPRKSTATVSLAVRQIGGPASIRESSIRPVRWPLLARSEPAARLPR